MRPKSALYYIPEMEEIAGELVKKINMVKDKVDLLDPSEVLHEYAAEAVGSVFMGARLGALQGMEDGRRLIKNQEQAMLEYMKIFLFPPYLAPYHPAYWKFVALCDVNFDICKKYVDQAIARGTHTDESVMAKLVRKCGKDSPIPLIMVIDALQVGIDTTGSTATLLLYHLASNQDKQERLYQEICDVLGPNGQMTEAALSKMKYLKACQTESQRILPATFGSSRLTTQEMVFGDYQIPAGTTVFRCGSSSNDPNNFTNPEIVWIIGRRTTAKHCSARWNLIISKNHFLSCETTGAKSSWKDSLTFSLASFQIFHLRKCRLSHLPVWS